MKPRRHRVGGHSIATIPAMVVAVIGLVVGLLAAPSLAEPQCGYDTDGQWVCEDEEGPDPGDDEGGDPGRPPEVGDTRTVEAKVINCQTNGPPPDAGDTMCTGATVGCERTGDDGEEEQGFRYRIYTGTAVWDGSQWVEQNDWEYVTTECRWTEDEEEVEQVTPEAVLDWVRGRLPLSPEVRVDPPNLLTLVDFDTIFSAEAQTYNVTDVLLGQTVTVTATPTTYHWDFGDGASTETPDAGQAWTGSKADDYITHAYTETGTVQPTVAVTWEITFQVGGGPSQTAGEVTMPAGDSVDLQIVEKRSRYVGR